MINNTIWENTITKLYSKLEKERELTDLSETELTVLKNVLGTWSQLQYERTVAIDQLYSLGYNFGEKIDESELCEKRKQRSKYLTKEHGIC